MYKALASVRLPLSKSFFRGSMSECCTKGLLTAQCHYQHLIKSAHVLVEIKQVIDDIFNYPAEAIHNQEVKRHQDE